MRTELPEVATLDAIAVICSEIVIELGLYFVLWYEFVSHISYVIGLVGLVSVAMKASTEIKATVFRSGKAKFWRKKHAGFSNTKNQFMSLC